MTAPKPASAPPADDWQAMSDAIAYAPEDIRDAARLAFYRQHPTTAASAQVREVEAPSYDAHEYMEQAVAKDMDGFYEAMGRTKLAAPEPVPVAQGVKRFDAAIIGLDSPGMEPASEGEYVRYADHARIVAGMQQTIDTAIDVLDHSAEKIEALEASLAACRADAERYRWLQRNANPGFSQSGRPWAVMCASLEARTWEQLDAAIDAARAVLPLAGD